MTPRSEKGKPSNDRFAAMLEDVLGTSFDAGVVQMHFSKDLPSLSNLSAFPFLRPADGVEIKREDDVVTFTWRFDKPIEVPDELVVKLRYSGRIVEQNSDIFDESTGTMTWSLMAGRVVNVRAVMRGNASSSSTGGRSRED